MTTEHPPECGPDVLDVLRSALALARGRRLAFVQLLYSDSSSDLVSLPGGESALPTSEGPDDAPELTERERAVLRVLAEAEKPMKARTIGTRAGIPYTSHLREILASLKEKERVIIGPKGGYWLASRPLPKVGDNRPACAGAAFSSSGKGDSGAPSQAELAGRIREARRAKQNGHAVHED